MQLTFSRSRSKAMILALLVLPVLFILIFGLSSCQTKFYEAPQPAKATSGSADFTKYVAVGSTITAGFMDNALFTEGQDKAYPNLVAAKMKEANSELAFRQPLISSEAGWSGSAGLGRFLFVKPTCNTVAISGAAQPGESSVLPFAGNKAEVTNLAVPFLRITNINSAAVSSGTNYNNPAPYYERFTETGTKGIASEARKRGACFFSVWLGYVDALRYATSGGTTALVSEADFKKNIEAILDSLLATPNSKGVIANIPYVDLFPVVTNNNRRLTSTTDPARTPLRLTAAQADSYNAAIGSNIFSGAAGNRNFFAYTTGTGTLKNINTSKDFVVRSNVLDSVGIGPRDSLMVRSCTPNLTPRTAMGLKYPIPNDAVLDQYEIVALRAQIDVYNNIIKDAVTARNNNGIRLAIVDMKDFYNRLTDPLYGIAYGTNIIRANQPSLGPDFGGFYSLDRHTPTAKGQALLANEFIKVINQYYGATLSLYDPADFKGNVLPAGD